MSRANKLKAKKLAVPGFEGPQQAVLDFHEALYGVSDAEIRRLYTIAASRWRFAKKRHIETSSICLRTRNPDDCARRAWYRDKERYYFYIHDELRERKLAKNPKDRDAPRRDLPFTALHMGLVFARKPSRVKKN